MLNFRNIQKDTRIRGAHEQFGKGLQTKGITCDCDRRMALKK